MGQSKGGGYTKKETLNPQQMSFLNQLLSQSGPFMQQAAQGFSQFLPGGGGGEAIKAQAMKDYEQRTIPSILNAFGTGSKGSSALNQALASSAADLNTNLAAQLAQMQLQASQGLGSLGLGSGSAGLSTPSFAYMQRQPPLWQQLLTSGLGVGGQLGGAWLGRPNIGGVSGSSGSNGIDLATLTSLINARNLGG